MNRPSVSIFFSFVSACGLTTHAAQGRRRRQPNLAQREQEFNFLGMVQRQLRRSQVLLERENQALQNQREQAPQEQPSRPAQQQVVATEVDTRSERQKLLHGNLSIEEIKRIVKDEQKGVDCITAEDINLDDLSQVVVLPSSPKIVFLAETVRNFVPKYRYDGGFRPVEFTEDPFNRLPIPDWFMKLLNGEQVPDWFVKHLSQPNTNLQQELSQAQPPVEDRGGNEQPVRVRFGDFPRSRCNVVRLGDDFYITIIGNDPPVVSLGDFSFSYRSQEDLKRMFQSRILDSNDRGYYFLLDIRRRISDALQDMTLNHRVQLVLRPVLIVINQLSLNR